MQLVINISEESYKNIKEQVDKRDYPDMQIGKAIVDGVLTSNLGVPAFERLNAKERAALDMAFTIIDRYETKLKADMVAILDKMRFEIEGKYRVILKGTPKDDWAVRWNDCIDEVLQIIDKYRAEAESEENDGIHED